MPIQLIAAKSIFGDYGLVHEGQRFETDEETALSLEARGLAYRYYPTSLFQPRRKPSSAAKVVPRKVEDFII